MKLQVLQQAIYDPFIIPGTCPHCGKVVIFEAIGVMDVGISGIYVCGQRQCPDRECKGHVFIVIASGFLVNTYPVTKVFINKDNIPINIITSYEEAVECFTNNCYVASALMVRRTLEELCEDKKAVGENLKSRIANLKEKIIIPVELFHAMDELRLLGNDAAHIESQAFDKISKEEVSVAIEFTQEILKSVYQYSKLLDRLRSLKK